MIFSSLYVPVSQSITLCLSPFIWLKIYLSHLCMHIYLPFISYLSKYLPIFLKCPSVCVHIYLSIQSYIHLSILFIYAFIIFIYLLCIYYFYCLLCIYSFYLSIIHLLFFFIYHAFIIFIYLLCIYYLHLFIMHLSLSLRRILGQGQFVRGQTAHPKNLATSFNSKKRCASHNGPRSVR